MYSQRVESELREQMCEMGRRVWKQGFVAANDGNFSVRLDADHLLCTSTGISKGFMTPDQLAIIDLEMNQLSGPLRVTSEIRMHLAIYRERPDTVAIVHTHSPLATAFAVNGMVLPTGILPEIEVTLGVIPTIPYETPGTDAFADTVGVAMRQNEAALLQNHGVVTIGHSLEQAYFRMETVEHYCRILMNALHLGGWKKIPGEKLSSLVERKAKNEWDPLGSSRDSYGESAVPGKEITNNGKAGTESPRGGQP